MSSMLLAGDIGGTKTLLGLFDPGPARPQPIEVRSFNTLDYPDLPAVIEHFSRDAPIAHASIGRACFAVAGPVLGETAQLTNAPWKVEGRRVRERFGFARVDLLNDLQATAYGVAVLQAPEIHVLQNGSARPGGNVAVIAAGTGLGEALLVDVDGRRIALPSEGGRADFAPRNEREIRVLRSLIGRFGRAAVEHVVSGPGVVNIHRAVHDEPCRAVESLDDRDAPAAITSAALDGRCGACVEALDLFVDAYGAESGNLALRTVSTGGLFLGGGIAPKILGALSDGRFMRAFRAKTPFEPLLDAIPVKVILNSETGLLGAAVFAAGRR